MIGMVGDEIGRSMGTGKDRFVGNDWWFDNNADAGKGKLNPVVFRFERKVLIGRMKVQIYRKIPSMYRVNVIRWQVNSVVVVVVVVVGIGGGAEMHVDRRDWPLSGVGRLLGASHSAMT